MKQITLRNIIAIKMKMVLNGRQVMWLLQELDLQDFLKVCFENHLQDHIGDSLKKKLMNMLLQNAFISRKMDSHDSRDISMICRA